MKRGKLLGGPVVDTPAIRYGQCPRTIRLGTDGVCAVWMVHVYL